MKKLLLSLGILATAPIVADACLEDKTKTCAQLAVCPELKGKTKMDVAKMQLGSLQKAVGAIAPVVNGVTNFVNNTVPMLKKLPDVASDTVACAQAKTKDQINNACPRLNKARLDDAKLPMPPVTPGEDKESRYAFAMYNFSTMLSRMGDGFFGKIEGGKITGGLLFSFMNFLTTAQPQTVEFCNAKLRIADIRMDIESLRKALKYLAEGLKSAAEQKVMAAAAKAAKEADPFAAEPISMDEAPAGETELVIAE